MLVSGRAAQRLAAIYRQHNPDQPALALSLHFGATSAKETKQVTQAPYVIRAAVLDEPLRFAQEGRLSELEPRDSWRCRRDVHSEICMTCSTLHKLQLLHGSVVEVTYSCVILHDMTSDLYFPGRHEADKCNLFVQVSSQMDCSESVHLARVIALDAQQYRISVAAPRHAERSSSLFMTPPVGISQYSAEDSIEAYAAPSGHQQAWQDDVAYLAPGLAFNLNLQHQLWPLMPQLRPEPSQADAQSLTHAQHGRIVSASTDGQLGLNLPSIDSSLKIKSLRQFTKVRCVDVPQAGEHTEYACTLQMPVC